LTVQNAIDGMLSPQWVEVSYPALYQGSGTPALPAGVGYRFTEANPFSGALDGGSNAFATALWALDYLHWWAAHGCRGVNFHNRQWGTNDTIGFDGTSYAVLPIGYGLKAWDLGGHGDVKPVRLSPSGTNVTAYAIANEDDLFVTIINKEHGGGARDANITIAPSGFAAGSATSIVLTDGKRGDGSLTQATLGGATISGSGEWSGSWSPVSCDGGTCVLTVRATSAAVVHLTK